MNQTTNPPGAPDAGKLAWLGAALGATPSAAVAGVAALFAVFYGELVERGVPADIAGNLTEVYMASVLGLAEERG